MQNYQDIYSDVQKLDNDQLRTLIRSENFGGQTSGPAKKFLQTNLIVLDKMHALDFIIFCQWNPKSCPLVGVTNVEDPFFRTLGNNIDVRSDVPSYNVYKNGKLFKLTNNISNLWNENLLAFAIGCSFTFEHSLTRHGFKIDHIENNKIVPMYKSNIKNKISSQFKNTVVVSMRIFKKRQVSEVISIYLSFHWAHGKSVHVGDPKWIGINDINNPDWGDKPRKLLEDEVNVFWASGVTPQNAILPQMLLFVFLTLLGICLLLT